MSTIREYILVDDDPFNNLLNSIEIESALGEVEIKTFEIPEEALAFIRKKYSKNFTPTILFLDINMPTLTGWEFMEEYEKLSKEVKEQISVYILSSSVDPCDKDKAKADKCIEGFISKSLEGSTILSLAGALKN